MPVQVPKDIEERFKRGLVSMAKDAPKRNECLAHWRGEQFKYISTRNELVAQPTTTNWIGLSGKPPHRARTVRNFIFDIVEREVSLAMSRVPSYQVVPSTADPSDYEAARLGEKVLQYGLDKWGVQAAIEGVLRYAVIADQGFAWPYFDNSVGPYIDGQLGQGEIKIRVLGPNEVLWEPGLNFQESRWHGVQQARDIYQVMAVPGYMGGKLSPDANSTEVETSENEDDAKLVIVREYLERPCPKYPQGRWLTMANGKLIVPEQVYPCTDGKGNALDEPVLHDLSYAMDPEASRDQGLVRHLLDPQRAANNSINKAIEWVALALNPQLVILGGGLSKGQKLTDEPGMTYSAHGAKAEWRPVPAIPQELFQMKQESEQDMARIAAQNDIPSQVESGKGIQALIEKDQTRRGSLVANLARFYASVGKHCLYLVQKHYTEERMLSIRGEFGPDLQPFQGADLKGQADVRVFPESIEPQTKEGQAQKIQNIAAMFPGYFPPEVIISAMEGGGAEALINNFERDKGRVAMIIQRIREGTLMDEPPRLVFPNEDPGPELDANGQPVMQQDPNGQPIMETDPMTGEQKPAYVQATTVPGWMPRPFDGLAVHESMLSEWMKTQDYAALPIQDQEQANLYYAALLDLQTAQAQREAEQQTQMAQDSGMQNAAKPQGAKPMASQPAIDQGGGDQAGGQ